MSNPRPLPPITTPSPDCPGDWVSKEKLARILADHFERRDDAFDKASVDKRVRYLSAATAVRDTIYYAQQTAARPPLSDDKLSGLVEKLHGATRGLCSEDASKYVPRGVDAQDCIEAATAIEALQQQLRVMRPVIEAARGLSHGVDWNNGTHAKLHGYRQKLLDALPAALEALSTTEGSDR